MFDDEQEMSADEHTGPAESFPRISGSVPQIARARDGGTIATWDVGAAYLLTNDTQLGARGGVAANRNTPDLFLLLELAQRF